MTPFHAWLEQLTIERREQRLSPAAVALRIIHSSFVDRFGLKRLEAWLEIHEWDDWGGAPTGNGVEEYVKRYGVPVMEGEGLQAKFVPGTWRGGMWVKSANAAPEPDVTPNRPPRSYPT